MIPDEIKETKIMIESSLDAKVRKDRGTSNSRKIRRNKLIPCIVYGQKKKNIEISVKEIDLLKIIDEKSTKSEKLTIKINDKIEQVKVHKVQKHPFRSKILHVDFLRT